MKIVFNYEIFALQKYGGISRYFVELATAMKKRESSVHIVAPLFINRYLPPQKKELLVTCTFPRLYKNRFYDITDKTNVRLGTSYLRKHKADICHLTYYTDKPFFKGTKNVITIHDMIYELFPDDLPELDHIVQCKKRYIREADHIIAVSENTRKDLERIYPESKGKITVVLHGINTGIYQASTGYKTNKPYLLYVGNRIGYKNFSRLLDVYKQSPELHSQYDLLCFGGGSFSTAELETIAEFKGKVKQLEGDDELLASVYKGAALFVYPSSYEGFGMPVLEAMAAGCAVVCAESSSLPEVAGDAAFYFSADDNAQMKAAILDALKNNDKRKELIAKGLKRVSDFTWDACAERTLNVYKQLLGK